VFGEIFLKYDELLYLGSYIYIYVCHFL